MPTPAANTLHPGVVNTELARYLLPEQASLVYSVVASTHLVALRPGLAWTGHVTPQIQPHCDNLISLHSSAYPPSLKADGLVAGAAAGAQQSVCADT